VILKNNSLQNTKLTQYSGYRKSAYIGIRVLTIYYLFSFDNNIQRLQQLFKMRIDYILYNAYGNI